MNVRIEMLPPMRVAAFCAVSENPEADAWEKLRAWAEPRGFLNDSGEHPVFGFNNPSPSPDRKEYGYEFWIRIKPETTSTAQAEIKEVPGGRFAVLTHQGYPNPQVWKQLWDWAQTNGFHWRKTHELEQPLKPLAPAPDAVFSLYLPVE